MPKPMRTCIVCGTQHEYCGYCSEYDSLPKWKFLFDNENCKEIFHAVGDYIQDEMTAEDARKILDKCDLSYKEKFNKKIKETIDELYPAKKIPVAKVTNTKSAVSRINFSKDEDVKIED